MELDYWYQELEDGETLLRSANGACLMNMVLSGCRNLQVFELAGYRCENKHYEVLLRNDLSKLEELKLFIFDATRLERGLMSKVFENVKTKIKRLAIYGYGYRHEYTRPFRYHRWVGKDFFRLPVMKHLKHFQNHSTLHLELEGGASMLQNRVPNLEKLLLDHQTTSMFQKWTDGSTYNSIRKLSVRLVDEREQDGDEYYKGFSSEMMQRVEVAFSNIQTLQITARGTELCGLKYAFGSLKKLQTLRVDVLECDGIENSDYWDALLIGTPVEFVSSLRSTPESWNNVKCETNEEHPSIKNLTELQKLVLTSDISGQVTAPLISDVAFHYAFLEMPKLKEIGFGGRFEVSPNMERKLEDNLQRLRIYRTWTL